MVTTVVLEEEMVELKRMVDRCCEGKGETE